MRPVIFVVLVLIGITPTTTVATQAASEGMYVLHFSVSNQSVVQRSARISIAIDGQEVFEDSLPLLTQHHYRFFEYNVNKGEVTVRVTESNTGLAKSERILVDSEKWVRIKFYYSREFAKHHFSIDVSPNPIGIK